MLIMCQLTAMKDAEILSTLQLPPSRLEVSPAASLPRVPVFDACHVGVVLRAVLSVQAVVAVAALFNSADGVGWLLDTALLTAVTLPAVLVWLLLGCAFKHALSRWPLAVQGSVGVVLGALAGAFACGLWAWLGLSDQAKWVASNASGALVASVLVAGLVWRARAQLPATTQARLAELQSRIRPHFLFNTLNSAIALVRAEPARAEALLEDLSELFRSALANPLQDVTLAQEVHLAERYLAIEQVRFGDRLRLTWALDPAASVARLPPLILQPLVENAVRHGVEPSPDGADVHISTQRRGDRVVIKVSNSMPGGAGPAGNGLALANVGERLALLHDLQASLRHGVVDGVFQVRMEVPA